MSESSRTCVEGARWLRLPGLLAAGVLALGLPLRADDFNLGRDFSASINPNGVWSFGWKANLGGGYSNLTVTHTSGGDNGVLIPSWQLTSFQTPAVYCNTGSVTASFGGGAGHAEQATVWFSPGENGRPENFGVIRFTAPSNGNYRVETTVRPVYNGSPQGDTDFHVVTNGTEVFSRFLSPTQSATFTGIVSLAANDVIDLAIGRGTDGNQYGSTLKIAAIINCVTTDTNPPPPVLGESFDVSQDFALSSNPNGVWSYGWKSNFIGELGLLAAVRTFGADNGVPIRAWELTTYHLPVVAKVLGPETAVSDGDHFTAAAGTVYFAPGEDETPQNYGVIRFTAPTNGDYHVETAVNALFDGTRSRDSDFHVLRNGEELFGVFLPPNSGTNFDATVTLAPGGTVEFLIGRGADGTTADTGLKITAAIHRTTNGVTNPPPPGAHSLVSLWRADGNAQDSIDSNHGTLVGGTGFRTGVSGSAFSIPGETSAVRIAASPGLNVGTGPGFTVQLWVNPADVSRRNPLVEWDNAEVFGAHLHLDPNQHGPGMQPPSIHTGGPGAIYAAMNLSGQWHQIVSDGGLVPSNTWSQVAWTYDRTSGVSRLFFNGAIVSEQTFGDVTAETAYDLYLGRRAGAPSGDDVYSFNGGLDEVGLYNYALSPSQVRSNYLQLAGSITNPPPVVTNPPPPEVYSDFNLGRDFSASVNPSSAWSYGWKNELGGIYSNLTVKHTSGTDNGVLIPSWQLTSFQTPAVYCNTSSVTASFGGGAGHAEQGTVWYYPGENGRPENFGIIRFTAPSNGNYRIETTVRPVYNGSPQGDTDFHVVTNGIEVFAQFLAATESTSFTGVVSLAAEEVIDLAIGRGADGNQYGSGLKIAALITPTTDAPTVTNLPPPVVTNPPPPVVYSDFNVGRDFSAVANPNGVWSFGWKANLGGGYSNLTVTHTSGGDNGVLIPSWQLTSFQTPAVYCNTSSVTASFGGGAGHAEPGTVWYYPGENGRLENYGVIRFTAPSNGNYEVTLTARPVYDGPPQGNTDFHVLTKESELFGQFLNTTDRVTLTGVVELTANDTLDLAIGRGADRNQYGSGLKLSAVITPTTNAVSFTNPPPPTVEQDFNLGRDFSASDNPNGVWSFGWEHELGGAYSNLTVPHMSGTIPSWQLTSAQTPAVYCNVNDTTVHFSGGSAEPGVVWFYPGEDGRPENFGVIRFTAPSNGTYRIKSTVDPVYDGVPQGDTDFHVLNGGVEVFGQFLHPTNSAGFESVVGMSAGSTIDFAIGRGADETQYGSGLKISIAIAPTNTPSISVPSPSEGSLDFTVIGNTAGIIESSTNLIDWTEVQLPILTNSIGKMWIRDPSGASGLRRFYRVRPLKH